MDKIYILLPVYNRIVKTEKFIECLAKQKYNNYQLILIDDGSTDGTGDMVVEKIPNVVIIRGNGKWWWAGSLQQGYNWLKKSNVRIDDYVLIINNDTEFDENFLGTGVSILNDKKNTLLLAECYSKQTNVLIDTGVHVDWEHLAFCDTIDNTLEVNCFSTRGLFMRYDDMLKIGKFHPILLPHYLSDYEYTIRGYKMGMALVCDPRLKIYVDETTTGYHNFNDIKFTSFLKKYFSKRSTVHPIYFSSFIMLSCPRRWQAVNLVRIFVNTIRAICEHLIIKK